jgi:hypothetical protein
MYQLLTSSNEQYDDHGPSRVSKISDLSTCELKKFKTRNICFVLIVCWRKGSVKTLKNNNRTEHCSLVSGFQRCRTKENCNIASWNTLQRRICIQHFLTEFLIKCRNTKHGICNKYKSLNPLPLTIIGLYCSPVQINCGGYQYK